MRELSLDSHGERLAAWHLPATSDALAGDRGRPCVVMAHGFGATMDSGLLPFAERFAATGADVVLFDYRGFGASDGAPRQNVDHRRHREDYHAALAFARTLDDVDPDRVVLWGSSYSGGHVIAVAAADPRVAGVISQGAAMDGLRAVLQIRDYAGTGQILRLTAHALRDVVGSLVGRSHTIAVFGPPGAAAAITSPDAATGYGSIIGPTFRNEMLARGILPILRNRPVTLAARLRMPLLLVIAEHDSIAPVAAVRAVARKAGGRVETVSYDVGHFDIYTGEEFERSVTEQVRFLQSL